MAGICSNLLLTCRSLLSVASGNSSTSQRIGGCVLQQLRGKKRPYVRPPRIKYPMWFLQKERAKYDEQLTKPNAEFVQEIVHDTFGPPMEIGGVNTYNIKTPLRVEPMARGEWNIKSIRTGVIARKIGTYPLWTKDGKVVHTTLLQVVDNHVIKYIPPEEFHPPRTPYKCPNHKMHLGCLLVGAESADPQRFTREYCGIFTKSGVMPKKILGRFLITPEAAVQPGTRLTACHFKPGQWVDVRGKTIFRDFQGVMKRWGFHGMPATHGQTKTHRRPGCIGGPKARVWPGKKLPGHMGNRFRITRGLQVLRINTKYNVLWVKSTGIPGETGDIVYIYDSQLYLKRNNHHKKPYFPTFYPEDLTEPLPEDLFTDNIFHFDDPTIDLQSESK